jgi:hypothetical protein
LKFGARTSFEPIERNIVLIQRLTKFRDIAFQKIIEKLSGKRRHIALNSPCTNTKRLTLDRIKGPSSSLFRDHTQFASPLRRAHSLIPWSKSWPIYENFLHDSLDTVSGQIVISALLTHRYRRTGG